MDDAELRKKLEQLDELIDRQAINDCIQRYSHGIDRFDAEALASVYHDDALDDHGSFIGRGHDMAGYWHELIGKEGIVSQHHVTTSTVELDGDTAHAETYGMAVIRHHDGKKIGIGGGRYVDRLEKRNGEWRIAARICVVEWRGSFDAGDMEVSDQTFVTGKRDRTDVRYMRPLEVTREQRVDRDPQR
jgi:ketosteroid isomerase-like protein